MAFDSRGENKDAYDLYYVIANHELGPLGIADRLRGMDDRSVNEAIGVLKRDFNDIDGVGPIRVSRFIRGEKDDEVQADVVGFVATLLNALT